MQLRWLVTVALVGLLAACGTKDNGTQNPPPSGGTDSGTTCANPCGSNCCTAEQTCNQSTKACEAKTCVPNCTGKQCGDDSCGGSCGMCLAGQTCTAGGTCSQCTPNCNGKSCGDDGCGGTCAPGCGSNETCTAGVCIPGGSSDGGTTGTDGGTIPADGGTTGSDAGTKADGGTGPVTNDDCTSPETITLTNGAGSTSGDNSGAMNDTSSSTCGGSGNDVFYTFTLASQQNVTITVTPSGAGNSLEPVIYVRTTCATESTEVACDGGNIGGSAGKAASIVKKLNAGTYSLIVDGYAGSKGAFDLTIKTTTPNPAPLNDTCTGTVPDLTFTNNAASITGDTTDASGDYSGTGSCSGTSSGNDLVFQFTTTADQAVTATVTRDTTASTGFSPYVYIRSTCAGTASTDQVLCGTNSSGTATAKAGYLPKGTYYVIVDSSGSTGGKFTLDVTLSAPVLGDTCAKPETLTFTNGAATASGDNSAMNNDITSDCGGSGNDLVYQFTTTADQSLTVTVTPKSGSTLEPVISLRTACADDTTEVDCNDSGMGGSAAKLTRPILKAGTYFLWVDGYAGSKGTYDLSATLGTPAAAAANDTCTAPTKLMFTNNAASVTGSTANSSTTVVTDDAKGSCQTSSAAGNDLVYQLDLTAAQKVSVKVTPTGTSFKPVVYLRKSSCSSTTATDELACGNASSSGTATGLLQYNLAAGSYWIFVDSDGAAAGDFTLDVALDNPITAAPSNESCTAPAMLTLTNNAANASGQTITAVNDVTGSCSGTGNTSPDVVYQFTTTAAQQLVAMVTTQSTTPAFKPIVYLRKNACTSAATTDELACSKTSTGYAGTLVRVDNAPAGTYYAFVEGSAANDTGEFKLDVISAAPPANDTCTGVVALSSGRTTQGTTFGAKDDFGTGTASATCDLDLYPPLDGVDVVYSYTPTTSGNFTVTVTPTNPTFDLALWVSSGTSCTAATALSACVAASDNGFRGETESVTINGAANTTYYIVVDGYTAFSATTVPYDAGQFTISVK